MAPYVVGVKVQSAFFEALGFAGVRALRARVRLRAHGRSARGRRCEARRHRLHGPRLRDRVPRAAPSGEPLADALTVNPYLGRDSLEPFIAACRRGGGGLFCLVKTSNAGGADVQDLVLSDGHPLWHQVARLVDELGADVVGERGLSSVGAVVGATHPRAIGEARRLLPQAILLLPGVGAQGASGADVARAFTSGPASALVAASRSIIYARHEEGDWRAAAAAEAARLPAEIWAASGW